MFIFGVNSDHICCPSCLCNVLFYTHSPGNDIPDRKQAVQSQQITKRNNVLLSVGVHYEENMREGGE